MLFCAPKLVWDLLSRSSVCPLKLSIPSSVCQSIRLSVRYSILHLSVCFSVDPSIGSSLRSSIRLFFLLSRLSVRPPTHPPSLHSFVSLSIRMSVHFVCPSIHTLECPFLRPSMCLSICPSVHPVHQSDLSF